MIVSSTTNILYGKPKYLSCFFPNVNYTFINISILLWFIRFVSNNNAKMYCNITQYSFSFTFFSFPGKFKECDLKGLVCIAEQVESTYVFFKTNCLKVKMLSYFMLATWKSWKHPLMHFWPDLLPIPTLKCIILFFNRFSFNMNTLLPFMF